MRGRLLVRLIARRCLHSAGLLAAVSAAGFLLLEFSPGRFLDEARLDPSIAPQTLAALRQRYGLDDPLPTRYLHWLQSTLKGEFGFSFSYNRPVSDLIGPRILNTALLAVTALMASWPAGLALGLWSAARRGRWPDRVCALASTAALAVPEIIVACALLLVAVQSRLFPAGGMWPLEADRLDLLHRLIELGRHLALPVLALTFSTLPVVMRHARSVVEDASRQPFALAARAHGITGARLWLRHLFPPAAGPVVSLLGLSVAGLFSTTFLVESVFGWPGLGPLLLEAIRARDVHLVIGSVMIAAASLAAGNLIADLLQYALDPRIRID